MKPSLQNYVICPRCQSPLTLKVNRKSADEILSGEFTCERDAQHQFPIRIGVPDFVIQKGWPEEKKQTQETFSKKWQLVPHYAETARGFMIDWFLKRYGFNTAEDFRKFLIKKRFILDAATGLGRDANFYAANTKGVVFAVDYSEGIYKAYSDYGYHKNLHFMKADFTKLPFKKPFFDFIACEQALHHTPDTYDSLKKLVRHLEKRGHFFFYVYKKKGPIREFCDDYIRQFTSKMSFENCYKFCESITLVGKSIWESRAEITIPRDVPILEFKKGTHNLQRFIYWNIFRCFWNESFDLSTNISFNFDWYRPALANRHSPEEVKSWLEQLGVQALRFYVEEPGITVIFRNGHGN